MLNKWWKNTFIYLMFYFYTSPIPSTVIEHSLGVRYRNIHALTLLKLLVLSALAIFSKIRIFRADTIPDTEPIESNHQWLAQNSRGWAESVMRTDYLLRLWRYKNHLLIYKSFTYLITYLFKSDINIKVPEFMSSLCWDVFFSVNCCCTRYGIRSPLTVLMLLHSTLASHSTS